MTLLLLLRWNCICPPPTCFYGSCFTNHIPSSVASSITNRHNPFPHSLPFTLVSACLQFTTVAKYSSTRILSISHSFSSSPSLLATQMLLLFLVLLLYLLPPPLSSFITVGVVATSTMAVVILKA